MDNSSQIEFWNGEAGGHWVSEARYFDRMLQPFIPLVLEKAGVAGGGRVIDVGCGSGTLSVAAAEAGADHVTGVDVSAPMLSLARERAAPYQSIEFIEADASSWSAHQPFNRLISRFGVMFFADPVAAFIQLRGQLVPGGNLAFSCWQSLSENKWALMPILAVRPLLNDAPQPAEPGAPSPFAFEDATRTASILKDAGWSKVDITPWKGELTLPGDSNDETVDFMMRNGPAARLMKDHDLDPDRARAALEAALSKISSDDGPVAVDAAAWIVSATA
ncbi:MAG: class I SAM-dependent methyltransferase [Pseudomonadota bacterium]|nr:class I SAM-dependent methyltransferase [Pseudomonadota bacterium]